MTMATLEHVNFTVKNARQTAALICDIFGWKVRWHGNSLNGGYTYHVGTDDNYLAIYNRPKPPRNSSNPHARIGRLNHVGIVADDLEAIEDRVRSAGFKPFNHSDYEPGRRFYFYDDDGIEYEVVSYAEAPAKKGSEFEAKLGEMAMAGMTDK